MQRELYLSFLKIVFIIIFHVRELMISKYTYIPRNRYKPELHKNFAARAKQFAYKSFATQEKNTVFWQKNETVI